ncbi:hypothetical protein CNR22_21990 [Sphingobacteriaceae bacterium]|nr:hypothetical protein CNR22_21990 [Sphingobacteriaceae bacterium]
MDTFLVHITLPDVFSKKLYEIIPKQREHINKLLEQQLILSYSLDMERKNLWIFIQTESEKDVMDLLSNFPIIKHVTLSIHELAFHDSSHKALPDLIMN